MVPPFSSPITWSSPLAKLPLPPPPAQPVRAKASDAEGPVKIGHTYAGRALKGVHIGPRSTLAETYRQLEDHMAQQHLEPNGRSWEQYVGDSREVASGQLETHVFLPVKPGA